MKVHILRLVYDIMFNDSDHGSCYAGRGEKLISVHKDLKTAQDIADEFNPILKQAEEETIVYPVQPYSKQIQKKFGFTPNDIPDDWHNLELRVDSYDVED
jgi:hypothetical protein